MSRSPQTYELLSTVYSSKWMIHDVFNHIGIDNTHQQLCMRIAKALLFRSPRRHQHLRGRGVDTPVEDVSSDLQHPRDLRRHANACEEVAPFGLQAGGQAQS